MVKDNDRRGKRTIHEDVSENPGPNPFFDLSVKLCTPQLLDGVKPLPRPASGKVKIALVSMPNVAYPQKNIPWAGQLPRGVSEDDVRLTLTSVGTGDSKILLAAFQEALTVALEQHGANIVCFSELGLPSHKMMPMDQAQTFAFEMSRKHQALVIAGTAHDSRTKFNTGYLFHPTLEQHARGATWAFHKNASAHKMNERIMAPAHRRVAIIDTFDLKFAVMICLDVLDYTSLAAVMRAGDHLAVVLVPCYTTRFEKMQDVARVASKALPGVVALVNAQLPSGPRFVAHCGDDLALTGSQKLGAGAEIALIELEIDQLHERRTAAKTDINASLDWMFGSRYRPRLRRHPESL